MDWKESILRMLKERNELAELEDGFIYWWPTGNGAVGSHHLRAIADELDRLNQDWQDRMDAYFREQGYFKDSDVQSDKGLAE